MPGSIGTLGSSAVAQLTIPGGAVTIFPRRVQSGTGQGTQRSSLRRPFCTSERTVSRPARPGRRAGQLWGCTRVCPLTWPFVSRGILPLPHPFSVVWRTSNSLEARKTSSVPRAPLASCCPQTRPFQPQAPGRTAPAEGRTVPTQHGLPGPAPDADLGQDHGVGPVGLLWDLSLAGRQPPPRWALTWPFPHACTPTAPLPEFPVPIRTLMASF